MSAGSGHGDAGRVVCVGAQPHADPSRSDQLSELEASRQCTRAHGGTHRLHPGSSFPTAGPGVRVVSAYALVVFDGDRGRAEWAEIEGRS